MQLLKNNIEQIINEAYLIETLNLDNKTILELGCGSANMTKQLAQTGVNRKIIACEVDEIQHKKNLLFDIENIEFKLCGAQNIDLKDESVDMVFMFKSFHHIPENFMNKALDEIKRVLKPNGLAYISEPLHQGEQNELVAMFHNEEDVRKKAFEAIKNSVDKEQFKLFKEIFFKTEITYLNFEDFEKKQMNLSYNDIQITDELKYKIKDKFDKYNDGKETTFYKPFRVDILQKIV
ncbi:SAM-dependent methyltransferase [Malaciobacter canalis]|uniref:SAM-dependent methyltransferase n=1 Tax=Malaciobacter canalis TaxID=1912871 RepID=A0ABX4LLR5_9BACT|nr:class I SAM-dependent methyltransferase [Malaciobacter canalis]PHO08757.1 SAM-dependent methyltransferase [Malaciobacter canalis]QEE32802.1 SAM-dependent methyltransferase [Malaciobacter canalis]